MTLIVCRAEKLNEVTAADPAILPQRQGCVCGGGGRSVLHATTATGSLFVCVINDAWYD